MIILLSFIGIFVSLLSNTEVLVGLLAVIVPALYWLFRKIKQMTKEELQEASDKSEVEHDINEIKDSLFLLSERLVRHMDSEDILSGKIIQLGEDLIAKIDNLAHAVSASSIQTIKAVMGNSDTPATLAEVYSNMEYDFIWGNKAYLDMVGITLQELETPGFIFLAVDEKERAMVRAAGESVGQRRETYDGEYNMVNAKTQEPIGRFRVIGYYIENPAGEPYYYLTIYCPIDDPAAQAK